MEAFIRSTVECHAGTSMAKFTLSISIALFSRKFIMNNRWPTQMEVLAFLNLIMMKEAYSCRAGATNDMDLVDKAFATWLYSLCSDICAVQKATWYSRDAFCTA